jgi:hypothetical protein
VSATKSHSFRKTTLVLVSGKKQIPHSIIEMAYKAERNAELVAVYVMDRANTPQSTAQLHRTE